MAMINYADKVALNTNDSIADINKCNASDMNSIKNAVNQNGAYTTLTACANAGQFYCTLEGTLSSGDIVKVKFPTITGTNNISLSIDGGTTYYSLVRTRTSQNVISNSLNNETIRFNGTNFVLESNCIYEYTFSSASSSHAINNLDIVADGGEYEISVLGLNTSENPQNVYLSIDTQEWVEQINVFSTTSSITRNTRSKKCIIGGTSQTNSVSSNTTVALSLALSSANIKSTSNYYNNGTFSMFISAMKSGATANITSLTISCDEPFKIGSRIKIYKK